MAADKAADTGKATDTSALYELANVASDPNAAVVPAKVLTAVPLLSKPTEQIVRRTQTAKNAVAHAEKKQAVEQTASVVEPVIYTAASIKPVTATGDHAGDVDVLIVTEKNTYMERAERDFNQIISFVRIFTKIYKIIPKDRRMVIWRYNIRTFLGKPELMQPLANYLAILYKVSKVTITSYAESFTIVFGNSTSEELTEAEQQVAHLKRKKAIQDDYIDAAKRQRGQVV